MKNKIFDQSQIIPLSKILVNYKDKNNNFTVKKPSMHHFKYMIKVSTTHNKAY